MRQILTTILTLGCFAGFAQLRHPVYNDWDAGYSVGAYGRYQVASNNITSNLVWGAFQGHELNRNQRERASSYLFNMNRLGVDLDYGIFAKHLPDSSKGLGWYINIADRTHANARFSRDFFNLVMFGNAQFADKTVDLSGLELNFMTYKQFEVGILKSISHGKGKWNLGLGLSLLTGNRDLHFKLNEASLYTHPDGEYLEGTVKGEIRSSSLASTQYFDANGLGFSTALNIGYEAKKFGIRLQTDDLGFISWSQHLKETELDTAFTFEGIEVQLLSSDPFSTFNADTILSGLVTKLEPRKYTTVVPGRLRLEGFYRVNDKDLRLYLGVQHRFAPGYVPYSYVGVSSPLPAGFFIDGRFAYGGFGSWNLGLELAKKFGNVFEVRLGTNNLEGYVLPMFGTSQSAYVTLRANFK